MDENVFFFNWIADKTPCLASWHTVIIEHVSLDYLTELSHSKNDDTFKFQDPSLYMSSTLVR